jgi:iron-sulfur cluster assembly accessory protein
MTIGDILKNHPEAVEIMLSYGLHCVGCQVQFWETLEGGCLGHGFDEKKINDLVKDINAAITEVPEGKEFYATPRAAEKLKEMAEKDNKPAILRIDVVAGGCAGFKYNLDFDEEKQSDVRIESQGISFVMNKESEKLAKGAKIDYLDTLNESGFRISNPNAEESCGCGKSFN